jgi:hypothetical protein
MAPHRGELLPLRHPTPHTPSTPTLRTVLSIYFRYTLRDRVQRRRYTTRGARGTNPFFLHTLHCTHVARGVLTLSFHSFPRRRFPIAVTSIYRPPHDPQMCSFSRHIRVICPRSIHSFPRRRFPIAVTSIYRPPHDPQMCSLSLANIRVICPRSIHSFPQRRFPIAVTSIYRPPHDPQMCSLSLANIRVISHVSLSIHLASPCRALSLYRPSSDVIGQASPDFNGGECRPECSNNCNGHGCKVHASYTAHGMPPMFSLSPRGGCLFRQR